MAKARREGAAWIEASLGIEGVAQSIETDFVSLAESYKEDDLSEASKARRASQGVGEGGTWILLRKKWRSKEVSEQFR